jgi:hypothetical protein
MLLSFKAAYAFDEQIALKKFQTYAQENNVVFTFGAVEKPNDNTLIIKNSDYYNDTTKQRQQIELLQFNNVRQNASGSLRYDSLEAQNFIQKGKSGGEDYTVAIDSIVSDGLKFSNNNADLLPTYVGSGEITDMTVSVKASGADTTLKFPSASVTQVERTNLRTFTAKSITLAPSTGSAKTKDDTVAISMGAITIENMELFGAQGFDVGLIDMGALVMDLTPDSGVKMNFNFEGITVENFFSPDFSVENSPLYSDKDLSAEIKPLIVTLDGKTFMGWKRGYGTTKNDKAKNTTFSEGRIEGLYLDYRDLPHTPKNAKMIATLQELDLMTMVLNIDGSGSWNRETGLLNISRYDFELEDGATFGMSARISGYTEDVARQFSSAINAMNAETDPNKKNALALQTLAFLAGLSFERMELILNDQSLLDRVVNLQANKLKQEPEQIKGLVGPMTTILLTPYNIPEIASQASAALGTFMQGNKKLTVTAEPVNGLAITEMFALGSGLRAGSVTPADFAKRLNLTIIAE